MRIVFDWLVPRANTISQADRMAPTVNHPHYAGVELLHWHCSCVSLNFATTLNARISACSRPLEALLVLISMIGALSK